MNTKTVAAAWGLWLAACSGSEAGPTDAGNADAGCPTGRDCDPSLSSLVPSVGTLSPSFDPATTAYLLPVPANTTYVQLTPTVAQPEHVTITVDGTTVASGMASPMTPLRLRPMLVAVTTDSGATRSYTVVVYDAATSGIAPEYFKASNPNGDDHFGVAIALSADGSTLAIGAKDEDSSATGVNGNQTKNDAVNSGAVYVFVRTSMGWMQEAYIKASNAEGTMASDTREPGDSFGAALALSMNGSTLAIGAKDEDSSATGVGGDPMNNAAIDSGAVYVFRRGSMGWSQEAYVKASNTGAGDQFGDAVSLSADGTTLAVGAAGEDSPVNDPTKNTEIDAGAVYVFTRDSMSTWSQQAYLKASNAGGKTRDTELGDRFGDAVSLSADGATLAVGARGEDSSATGVGGDPMKNDATDSGAVYVFVRAADWSQEAYIKASNTDGPFNSADGPSGDRFGTSVAMAADGSTLAVGAIGEDSTATGVNGDQTINYDYDSGAVYVFTRAAGWSQQAYLKASHRVQDSGFGGAIALSSDGSTLAVGALSDGSSATGVGGDPSASAVGSAQTGAVYVFARAAESWSEPTYLKPPVLWLGGTATATHFGNAVSLSADGAGLAVGVVDESSHATGVGGDPAMAGFGFSSIGSGAAYVYTDGPSS